MLRKHLKEIYLCQENWYSAKNKLVGLKEFLVLDPDGYLLRFAQSIGEREAG